MGRHNVLANTGPGAGRIILAAVGLSRLLYHVHPKLEGVLAGLAAAAKRALRP